MNSKEGRVDRFWMESSCLAGNPLGDPSRREIHVWSPAQHGPDQELPWVLVLPAFTSTGVAYLSRAWRKPSLPQQLDRLMENGMAPVRVVLPDVMTAVGGSQYLDSDGIGQYASWLLDELPLFLAKHFPTSKSWGATGSSSGGYGALHMAMTRPGHFRAIAAHSPDSAFEVCYPPDFPVAVEQIRDAGGLSAWWSDFAGRDRLKGSDHAVLGLVGMACAYSPAPHHAPLPCVLPVDLDTGALKEEVFQQWLTQDPLRMIPEHHSALSELEGLYLDVGRKDEFRLQVGARLMARELERMGIECRFKEHDGGHFGLKSRLALSIPWLAKKLS